MKMNERNSSELMRKRRKMFRTLVSSFGTVFIPRTTDTNRASSMRSAITLSCELYRKVELSTRSVRLRVYRGDRHRQRSSPSAAIKREGNAALYVSGTWDRTCAIGARIAEIQSFHSLVSELCTGVVAGVLGA